MRIDLQLNPTIESWDRMRSGALLAEELGYDTLWVYDHFAGAMLGGSTMIECFTLLGALAASTTRLGLGSLVVNAANRHPSLVPHCAASVHAVSGGRFVLGVGAGAAPRTRWSAEHTEMGLDLPDSMSDRHARLERVLDELERFWDPTRPAALATFPLPEPRPPVVVGVNSVELARIAGARADGINVRSGHPRMAEFLAVAAEARATSGRTLDAWDASVWAHWDAGLLDPDHPDRRRWRSLGVGRLVLVCIDGYDAPALRAAGSPPR